MKEKIIDQDEFIDYEFISSKMGKEQIRLGVLLKAQWDIIDKVKKDLKNDK